MTPSLYSQISVAELHNMLHMVDGEKPHMLDVREPWEYEYCRIQDSTLIPMSQVSGRLADLEPEADVVVICHHGVRSFHVASFLEQQGFGRVYNLQGGVEAWARHVDPNMRKY